MKKIIFANQKGGCGKTTSAMETAYILSQVGNVILLDLDAQCNLTSNFDIAPNAVYNIFNLLTDTENTMSVSDCIVNIQESLDIIPGSRKLLPQYFTSANDTALMIPLMQKLETLKKYDFAICDVGPGAGSLQIMAMRASDYMVAVSTVGKNSYDGLLQLVNDFRAGKAQYVNFNIKFAGYLLTMADKRTNVTKNAISRLEELSEHTDTILFDTVIRRSVVADESKEFQMTVGEYSNESVISQDYKSFTKELLIRIHELERE